MPEAAAIDTTKKPHIFLHTVEVEIADEEMTARTSRLLDVLNQIDETEATKASRVSDLNATLKQLRKEAQKVRATINTRKEKRDVECYENPDERRNIVFIVRASDDKVLDERAMTLEDRMHVPLKKIEGGAAQADGASKPKGKGGKAAKPEQETEAAPATEQEPAAAKGEGGGKPSAGKMTRIKPSEVKKRNEARVAADKARELADANDAKNEAAAAEADNDAD